MAYYTTHKNLWGIFIKRSNSVWSRYNWEPITNISWCPSTYYDWMMWFDIQCPNNFYCISADSILYWDSNIRDILFWIHGNKLKYKSLSEYNKYKFFIEKYYEFN